MSQKMSGARGSPRVASATSRASCWSTLRCSTFVSSSDGTILDICEVPPVLTRGPRFLDLLYRGVLALVTRVRHAQLPEAVPSFTRKQRGEQYRGEIAVEVVVQPLIDTIHVLPVLGVEQVGVVPLRGECPELVDDGEA